MVGAYGNFMMQGGALYVMNAFMEPMCELNGWTRAGISTVLGGAALINVLSMPIFATLCLRMSPRLLMTAGGFLGGIMFMLLGQTTSLWTFGLAFGLLWVAAQACGGVVANILMNQWFVRHRGSALGVVNVGISLSGAILPLISLLLIDYFSVSMAYNIIGILCMLLGPLSWWFVRDSPQSLNLNPDGEAQATAEASAPQETLPWSTLFRMPNAYYVGLAMGIGIMTSAGIMSQLKPRFVDLGFDSYVAMGLMCTTALFAALGKYVWGMWCDVIKPLRCARLLMLANMAGLMLAFLPVNVWTVLAFCFVAGFGLGGFFTMLPALVAQVFGRKRFATVYRFVVFFVAVKSLGYPLLGFSHSLTGRYDAAYAILIALLFMAWLLLGRVRNPAE